MASTVLGWLAAGRVWGLWCGTPSLNSVHRRFLVVLDGATSHFTVYQCQSTSPSEVISKLHECMDTFQMNPKATCADRAFHHPHDMQAFHRMHNIKTLPTEPYTPWPNRAEIGVRLFKKFLSALLDIASKILDRTTLAQVTPAQLMRKAATVRKTQVTLRGRNTYGVSHGKKTKRFHGPSFHESRTAYIHINQTGSLEFGDRKASCANTS